MFNKNRLKLAREIRKLSKSNLATQINLSVQTLTEWERGSTVPKLENLCELSKILNFPVEFFNTERNYTLDENTISFRALTKMKAQDRDLTYSYAKLVTDLAYWIESKYNLPICNIETLNYTSPEDAASKIKEKWNINTHCIDDTIFLLEKNGIRVFSLMDNIEAIDAFSFWDNNIPFVILTHQKTPEHSRFDAMHELGHILLHKNNVLKNKEAEKEAHRFAAEMLMPEADVRQFAQITPSLNNFISLKSRWKVSLSAIVYRFYQLGYISEWIYRILNIEIKKRGYNCTEPNSIDWEESTVINKIYKLLKEDNLSIQDVAKETSIDATDINKLIFKKYSLSLLYGENPKHSKSKAKLTLL